MRFCEVEQSGALDRNDSTKVASSKIKIKAELSFADLIKAGIEWLKEKVTPEEGTEVLNDNGERKAKIGSSGDSAKIGSSGKNAVVMCAGCNSQAKAKKGSWITLAEWKEVGDEWVPVCVKTEKVDGERIKEDTWYILIDGEFKEATA